MKYWPAFLVMLLAVVSLRAQNAGTTWYFGHLAGLDFSGGAPVALTNSAMHIFEGCVTISNTDGQLLFYSNGKRVWDQTHSPMPGGSNLKGDTSSAQHLAVRNPDSCHLYYLFTLGSHLTNNGDGGLWYSVINMNLNGGYGDVESSQKNILLLDETSEGITAVRHGNGKDVWVITHKLYSTDFYVYPVTSAGIGSPVISSAGNYRDALTIIGQLEANHQGNRLGMTVMFTQPSVALFDFDHYTGVVSNEVEITGQFPVNGGFYGMEFSRLNNLLYLSQSFGTSFIHQYDINTQTVTTFDTIPGNYVYGSLERGPDEKIYVARNGQPRLDVFHDPETSGTACNYDDLAVDLGSGISLFGLPNHPACFFNEPKYDPCQVATSIPLYGNSTETVSVYPNPVSGILSLNGVINDADFEFEIMDMAGRVLPDAYFIRMTGSLSIDVSRLTSGLYFLKAGAGALRFVKQ